jgi:XTP/dITP diphosphohydrolase
MRPEIIVLATRNSHKILELQDVLSGLGVQLKSAFDFVELPDVDEDQDTLEGNALKKARVTFDVTGLPSLSDDTGLEVDVLDGRPGVYSARFAGENATYDDNVVKLISDLKAYQSNHPDFDGYFTARFRTVIAYVTAEGEYLFHGVCEGQIIFTKKGSNGFGYDPIFVPLGYEQTFAEMDSILKNKISHRSLASENFKKHLENTAS